MEKKITLELTEREAQLLTFALNDYEIKSGKELEKRLKELDTDMDLYDDYEEVQNAVDYASRTFQEVRSLLQMVYRSRKEANR